MGYSGQVASFGRANFKILGLSNNHLQKADTYRAESLALDNNKLQELFITVQTTFGIFDSNLIRVIKCEANLSMDNLNIRNNSLRNMICIKEMANLTSLDISLNKFSKLNPKAFQKLTKLKFIDVSGNRLKKLAPKIFANSKSLANLKVAQLKNYKNLRNLFAKMYAVSSNTSLWKCRRVQNVTAFLKAVKIVFSSNGCVN
jgi:Leucine-rich repeat (LRR) protein